MDLEKVLLGRRVTDCSEHEVQGGWSRRCTHSLSYNSPQGRPGSPPLYRCTSRARKSAESMDGKDVRSGQLNLALVDCKHKAARVDGGHTARHNKRNRRTGPIPFHNVSLITSMWRQALDNVAHQLSSIRIVRDLIYI